MATLPGIALLIGIASLAGFGLAAAQDAAKGPTSLVPAPRTDDWAIKREAECIRRAKESAPVHVVFVGDSITQSWEDPGKAAWAKHIAPLGALNLGNSGDRTENVLWRLEKAPLTRLNPKHIVLLIGTNNLGHGTSNAQETLEGVKAVATRISEQCPEATVHILEIFPRGERINNMRGDICQVNQALRAFVREHRNRNGSKSRLEIVALGDAFVGADGVIPSEIMPDFLHLTPKGYEMWAEAIFPRIAK
jgi:lysophospholipase L1-like esterase